MALLIKKPVEYGDSQALYETSLTDDLLVVGLGNPGPQHHHQRHNIGWRCLDAWAVKQRVGWQNNPKLQASIATTTIDNCRIRLMKPQTYVNRSGVAVAAASHYFKTPTSRIWVVYDEIQLNWGRLGVVIDAPLGSHNGLASIAQNNSQIPPLPRIQIGIGPQPKGWDRADFVLSNFSNQQETVIDSILTAAAELISEAAGGRLSAGQHQVLTALDQG